MMIKIHVNYNNEPQVVLYWTMRRILGWWNFRHRRIFGMKKGKISLFLFIFYRGDHIANFLYTPWPIRK